MKKELSIIPGQFSNILRFALSKRILPSALTFLAIWLISSNANAQFGTSPWTAPSGTYTVPAGVVSITVQAWGGGGSGGSQYTSSSPCQDAAGGGGGGGAFAQSTVTVTPGGTVVVTVGTGGTPGTGNRGRAGLPGTASVITYNAGTVVSAAGGAAGGAINGNGQGAGGAGGTTAASTGTIKYAGGNGGQGYNGSGTNSGGGGGGGAGSGGAGTNAAAANGTSGPGGAGGAGSGGNGGNGSHTNGGAFGGNGASFGGGGGGSSSYCDGWGSTGGTGGPGNVVIQYVECTVYPVGTGTISGQTTVCTAESGVAYSITSVTNATSYGWTVPSGATVASGQGTQFITVDWGSVATGNRIVSCTPYTFGSCAGTTSNLTIALNPTPAVTSAITKPNPICLNAAGNYSVTNVSGMTYVWTLPGGWTGSSTTNVISATPTTTVSGNITVVAKNRCNNVSSPPTSTTVAPSLPPPITPTPIVQY